MNIIIICEVNVTQLNKKFHIFNFFIVVKNHTSSKERRYCFFIYACVFHDVAYSGELKKKKKLQNEKSEFKKFTTENIYPKLFQVFHFKTLSFIRDLTTFILNGCFFLEALVVKQ